MPKALLHKLTLCCSISKNDKVVMEPIEQMKMMKQLSLAETGFLPKAGKPTRKAVFLAEMEAVVAGRGSSVKREIQGNPPEFHGQRSKIASFSSALRHSAYKPPVVQRILK